MSGIRISCLLCGCLLLSISCSKRERTDPQAEEWSDIVPIPMTDDALSSVQEDVSEDPDISNQIVPAEEFDAFARRLEAMKTASRKSGETLLTGESLVFDYHARFVRMDGAVQVEDDHGRLETESLIGRFSNSNRVEYVEAEGGVSIFSGERQARAEEALYNYLAGTVQLDGQAVLTENGSQLAGERIRFWITGDRRMICEPNALLIIAGGPGVASEELPEEFGDTEIRANQIVYDESIRRVDILGHVRLRNAMIAMNCDEIHLYLKDNNEIDWIEALSEVIIQSEDRKALADRAVYEASEGKFTLEGHPMVVQGRNIMTGDRIYIWPDERGAVCENARALLHLDAETRAKLLKDLND